MPATMQRSLQVMAWPDACLGTAARAPVLCRTLGTTCTFIDLIHRFESSVVFIPLHLWGVYY
jgi:hypothetical protein